MTTNIPGPSRKDARAALAQQRAADKAKARRRERTVRIVAVVGALVLVLGGGALAYVLNRPDAGAKLPAGVGGPGQGIAFGAAAGSGKPVVDLWEDFQCPICGELEKASGEKIRQLADSGQVRLVIHPASFIGEESVRAANAFGCASDAGKALDLHAYLYAHQPPERSGGYTVDDLLAAGKAVGIDSAQYQSCVKGGTYEGWVGQVADAMSKAGVTGTPTVFVNGKELARQNVPGTYSFDEIKSAVDAAAKS